MVLSCNREAPKERAPLKIERIYPACGPSNHETTVLITGGPFDPGTRLRFGGAPPTRTEFRSATVIVATLPPAAVGPLDVTVSGAAGRVTVKRGYARLAPSTFDPNGDCRVDATDVFYLQQYLERKGPPPVLSADANGDGAVDRRDLDQLVAFLFAGGPPPAQITQSFRH